MFIQQIFEAAARRVIVTYPGRFQPFHKGHAEVFANLQRKYGGDNVFIVTSNKTDAAKSPFSFSDKVQFMHAMGVPNHNIVQADQVYDLPAEFNNIKDQVVFITVIGAPDEKRLQPGRIKKDGTPGYFQTLPSSAGEFQTADKHGYVIIEPEHPKNISIGGKIYDVSHGTPTRDLWNQVRNNPKQRQEFIQGLYGVNDPELGKVLDKIPTGAAPAPAPAAKMKNVKKDLSKVQHDPNAVAESNDYEHGFADPNAPQLGNKAGAKRAELQHELGHEQNNLAIAINSKVWKVIPGKGYADSKEEWSYLNNMKNWAAKKSASSGKKWTVHLTGAPVTVDESFFSGSKSAISENTIPVTHRIGLTVTDPNHPMVSKRGETYHKTVRVKGDDREKAINGAIAHYRRKGYKVHDHHYIGTVDDEIKEFAPPGSGDDGNDGFSDETLKRMAAQWYNGDEDPRVEKTLMAAGWEIGQDEGYDDEPGVFVVQAGDVNGNSYMSWPANELRQGMAEGLWDQHTSIPELEQAIKNLIMGYKGGVNLTDKGRAQLLLSINKGKRILAKKKQQQGMAEASDQSNAISQEQLNQMYANAKPMMFIKNTPVALVPLAKINQIGTPQQVQQVQQALGSVDQTSYTDEYKNKGYVVFQWNGTALDLYVASPEVVAQKYVKFNGQLPQDDKSRGKIPSLIALGKLGIDPSKVPFFVKKVPTQMVSAKQLGLEGKTIQTSWGEQTVSPGGFMVREENGHIYTVAPDAQGLPIGYLPAQQGVAEGATGAKPGWMLKQDPALAKKVKDSKRGHEELKKWAGKPVPKDDKQGMAEGAEQMTPNWAKYVLDQIYNSNGTVTLTDLFDEGIPGLHDMFMDIAQQHGLDPEEEFEEVQHELTLELEDLIKGGHDIDESLSDSNPITGAITRRILQQRTDLLKQYGPELVGAAIDNVADYVGDVDEIGSSDVSAWVNQVERMLKENPPEAFAEGKKPDNYHIVDKDGKPASLASYADRASAEKDRDAKHPGAEVRQVGPRGKVKGVSEDAEPMDREFQLVKNLGRLGQRIVQNPKLWDKYSEENDSDDPDWIISLIQDSTGATFEEVLRLSDLFGEIGGGLGRIIDFAWAVKEGHWEKDFLNPYREYRSKWDMAESGLGLDHKRNRFKSLNIDEEAAGVGVVASKKQAKDPRYSMSLTKDVRPGQVNKSLRAFSLAENAEELSVGDPVIITGDVQFQGKTGDIDSFGADQRFVIVNLYNHGKHSFHSSDVSYNDYADKEDDLDEDLYQYDKEDPYNSEFAPRAGMGRMTLRGWKQQMIKRTAELAQQMAAAGQDIDKSALWDNVHAKLKSMNMDPIAQEIEQAQAELARIRSRGGIRSRAFNK